MKHPLQPLIDAINDLARQILHLAATINAHFEEQREERLEREEQAECLECKALRASLTDAHRENVKLRRAMLKAGHHPPV